tara:strand:+ start:442 stop:1089 length:648 start_codon:yes stop_codon:yes gene_type:complete
VELEKFSNAEPTDLRKFVKVFNDTLQPKIIGSCIKYLNTLNFHDAGVIGGGKNHVSPMPAPPKKPDSNVDKSIRNTQTWEFTANTLTDIHWRNLFRSVLVHVFRQYQAETNIHTQINATKIVTLNVLKYEEGGFYIPHSDSHALYPRTISVVYFLNNDYEGGELVFHTPDKECKEMFRVKAAPGRAVLWPSNFLYPHSVTKVTKGRRYALVSWLA